MTGTIRIIAGQWRGRKMAVPDRPGLRPTGDRARETLFNWIGPRIVGKRVLDLFAGTGALGLEAASRGAAAVVLIERDRCAARAIRNGPLQWPGSETVTLVEADALDWLNHAPQPFDLVLMDPPFESRLHEQVLSRLGRDRGWLGKGALVYLECAPDQLPECWPPGLELLRQKRVGQVTLTLLQHSASQAGSDSD